MSTQKMQEVDPALAHRNGLPAGGEEPEEDDRGETEGISSQRISTDWNS